MSLVVKDTGADRAFVIFNTLFMSAVLVATIFPLWFVVIASFSNPDAVNRGEVVFWIRDFDLIGYDRVFRDNTIWTGYFNTIIYTAFGAVLSLAITLPFAYAIGRTEYFLRKPLTVMMIITWYFHGGLIPTFLVVNRLGLIDTRAIIIVLGSFAVWNTVIARTFFRNTIPEEFWDSARIDGCSHGAYFFHIVIPLSRAIIVVILLFSGVAQWNDFFKALMFLNDQGLYPLQMVLRRILIQTTTSNVMSLDDLEAIAEKERLAGIIKYTVIIIGAAPLLILYPFLQKYFLQGMMIGSVKG
jgi:putative aldouronate transport system permease protein